MERVVVFGLWWLACVTLAIRAIRRDDIVHHRRWMIRGFAVGVAVGSIRIWQGIFIGAELWLRARPNPPELSIQESQRADRN